jgi:hypothetical protein
MKYLAAKLAFFPQTNKEKRENYAQKQGNNDILNDA